jgi:DNA-binding SARP family transcriptional activator
MAAELKSSRLQREPHSRCPCRGQSREPGWRPLMDAHVAADAIGSKLDAYARYRAALTEALGAGPSAIVRERHAALLAQRG